MPQPGLLPVDAARVPDDQRRQQHDHYSREQPGGVDPVAGWQRDVQSTGSGENAVIQKVTWSNGSVPTEEDAVFQFLASPDAAQTYEFSVRQTYSDGSVVDWTGPESSDTPAPSVESKSSLGGGSSSTLEIVAIVLAGVALVIALLALVTGRTARPLA